MKLSLTYHYAPTPANPQSSVFPSSSCVVPLLDSQKLLVDLATNIVDNAPVIEVLT